MCRLSYWGLQDELGEILEQGRRWRVRPAVAVSRESNRLSSGRRVEELRYVVTRERFGEVVPLSQLASEIHEPRALLIVLDTLCSDVQPRALANATVAWTIPPQRPHVIEQGVTQQPPPLPKSGGLSAGSMLWSSPTLLPGLLLLILGSLMFAYTRVLR